MGGGDRRRRSPRAAKIGTRGPSPPHRARRADQEGPSARHRLVPTAATIVVPIAVRVLVVALRPGPTALGPDSPEGAVQRYVAVVIDRDLLAARALVDAELADRCTAPIFDRSVAGGPRRLPTRGPGAGRPRVRPRPSSGA
jgi:hypothetical protein